MHSLLLPCFFYSFVSFFFIYLVVINNPLSLQNPLNKYVCRLQLWNGTKRLPSLSLSLFGALVDQLSRHVQRADVDLHYDYHTHTHIQTAGLPLYLYRISRSLSLCCWLSSTVILRVTWLAITFFFLSGSSSSSCNCIWQPFFCFAIKSDPSILSTRTAWPFVLPPLPPLLTLPYILLWHCCHPVIRKKGEERSRKHFTKKGCAEPHNHFATVAQQQQHSPSSLSLSLCSPRTLRPFCNGSCSAQKLCLRVAAASERMRDRAGVCVRARRKRESRQRESEWVWCNDVSLQ